MSNEQYIDLITGHLQGSLTDEEEAKFEKLVGQNKIDPDELEEMATLYQETGKLPVPESGEAMRSNFYQMLEKEKQQTSSHAFTGQQHFLKSIVSRVRWQVAAGALATFVIGLLIGILVIPFNHQQQTTLNPKIEAMKASLVNPFSSSQPSASRRIAAVNISEKIPVNNNQLARKAAKILIHTMNNDDNVNVRLAAAEALFKYRNDVPIKRALIHSLTQQDNPFMQITLIHMLVKLKAKDAIPAMQGMLAADNIQDIVRNHLKSGIAKLKA